MSNIKKLNLEQRLAFEAVKAGWNVFITGGGGVGKSFLIDVIATHIDGVVLSAPTGIAALNISGATVHGFFGIPINVNDIFSASELKRGEPEKLAAAKVILIDEVSMLGAHMLDIIDLKLRNATNNNKPFGGKQVVFVGDFCQIESIVPKDPDFLSTLLDNYGSLFAYNSDSWKTVAPVPFVLTEPVRHSEDTLIRTLRNIRVGHNIKKHVEFLNQNSAKDPDDEVLRLFTTNAQCDAWNESHLAKLDGESSIYEAEIEGGFKLRPSPEKLALKIGARVIVTANDVEDESYVNGDMGSITRLRKKSVTVKLDRGKTIVVEPRTWEDIDYGVKDDESDKKDAGLEKEVQAKYSQIPLKLGYAITTHKSQGLTFEEAVIDLSRGTFSCGQAYVALSRVKTLSGLYLGKPLKPFNIKASQEAINFTINASKIGLSRRDEDIATLGIDIEAFNKDKPAYKINELKMQLGKIFNDEENSLDSVEEKLLDLNISIYGIKNSGNMTGGFAFEGEKYRSEQLYGTEINETLTEFNGIKRDLPESLVESMAHNAKRLQSAKEIEHPNASRNEFEKNQAEANNLVNEMIERMKGLGFSQSRTLNIVGKIND